jgi:hypothetical protein
MSKKYEVYTPTKLVARRIFTKSFKKSKNLLNSQQLAQNSNKPKRSPLMFRGYIQQIPRVLFSDPKCLVQALDILLIYSPSNKKAS